MYVLNFICVMQRAREAAVIVQAESGKCAHPPARPTVLMRHQLTGTEERRKKHRVGEKVFTRYSLSTKTARGLPARVRSPAGARAPSKCRARPWMLSCNGGVPQRRKFCPVLPQSRNPSAILPRCRTATLASRVAMGTRRRVLTFRHIVDDPKDRNSSGFRNFVLEVSCLLASRPRSASYELTDRAPPSHLPALEHRRGSHPRRGRGRQHRSEENHGGC